MAQPLQSVPDVRQLYCRLSAPFPCGRICGIRLSTMDDAAAVSIDIGRVAIEASPDNTRPTLNGGNIVTGNYPRDNIV